MFLGIRKIHVFNKGVVKVTSGYANGNKENPTYKEVCRGDTGFRECVES